MLIDRFGRTIDYLRFSVIDHCNLRCVYCMPLQGLRFTPSGQLLTAVEIGRLARVAAGLGFRKIRLTGGEPTLRADLIDIVREIGSVPGIRDFGLTTNGVLLADLARPLHEAGLNRINVHLDTLHPDRLTRVMRFGTLEPVLAGIEAAEAAGLRPIKINAVVVRDYNHEDAVDLARLTLARDWHVRFIELMPFGDGECARLSLTQFVPNSETRGRIEAALGPLTELPASNASDESRNFRLPNARGVVGFISPVSEPYCGTCSRLRLTADGKLRLCLLNSDELDLRSALRNGGGEREVARILREAVAAKPMGHHLHEGQYSATRDMFQLGG